MPLDEQSRRAAAIRRVALGETISKVCADLGRSRVWYYKWANRFEHDGSTGLEDRRRHNRSGNHTSERMQALILQSRDRLVRQARQGTSFRVLARARSRRICVNSKSSHRTGRRFTIS